LRKATINFFMSVCLSVRPSVCPLVCLSVRPSVRLSACNNSSPSGRIFLKPYIWIVFDNISKKHKFDQNSRRMADTLHEDQYTFLITFTSIVVKMKNVLDKFVGKIKTPILYSITFFRKSRRLWGNMEKKLYSSASHRWHYGAGVLHAGYLRLQAHTQNMQYLPLFHYNNGCKNAPQYYITSTMTALLNFALKSSRIKV
jgi:hypothetical protein